MSNYAPTQYFIEDKEYSHEDMALLAVAVANEKKAIQPIVLDLRNVGSAFTELFAIISATNSRQVYAIAEEIRMFFKNSFGLNPVSIDGMETCTWILLDYGFMFIHVFDEATREHYQIEQLWSKARNIPSDETLFSPLYSDVVNTLEKIKQKNTTETTIEI